MKQKNILTEMKIKYVADKANLGLARNAAFLWSTALDANSNEALIEEIEELVRCTAKDDWGENTHCLFERGSHRIGVENFDGRSVVINAKIKPENIWDGTA